MSNEKRFTAAIVDAFTAEPYSGNPASVVFLGAARLNAKHPYHAVPKGAPLFFYFTNHWDSPHG